MEPLSLTIWGADFSEDSIGAVKARELAAELLAAGDLLEEIEGR